MGERRKKGKVEELDPQSVSQSKIDSGFNKILKLAPTNNSFGPESGVSRKWSLP